MSNIDFYLRATTASIFTTAYLAGPTSSVVGPICGGFAVFAALDAFRVLADDIIRNHPKRPKESQPPDRNIGITNG